MRTKAKNSVAFGARVCHVLNYGDLRELMARVPRALAIKTALASVLHRPEENSHAAQRWPWLDRLARSILLSIGTIYSGSGFSR